MSKNRDPGCPQTEVEKAREHRERAAVALAKAGLPSSYIDDDGCEVSVGANGAIFYNAADWY